MLQGSVLGPVLLIPLANAIVNSTTLSTIRLFANDTIIYTPISTPDDQVNFTERPGPGVPVETRKWDEV